jgi:hypothetical protein
MIVAKDVFWIRMTRTASESVSVTLWERSSGRPVSPVSLY